MTEIRDEAQWQPYNNGAGRRIWFLARGERGGRMEYHYDRRGYLIRYARWETALRAAARLNAGEVAA